MLSCKIRPLYILLLTFSYHLTLTLWPEIRTQSNRSLPGSDESEVLRDAEHALGNVLQVVQGHAQLEDQSREGCYPEVILF